MITWRDHVNLSRYNIFPLQSPHNLDDVPIVMVLVLAGFDAIVGAGITSSTIIAAALCSWSFQRSYQGFWISPPFGCLVLMLVLGSGWHNAWNLFCCLWPLKLFCCLLPSISKLSNAHWCHQQGHSLLACFLGGVAVMGMCIQIALFWIK